MELWFAESSKASGETRRRPRSNMAGENPAEKSRNMVSSFGFVYSDVSSANPSLHSQTHLVNQIQSFESNPEMFSLTTGMEMIGFPQKNLQQPNDANSVMWKGFVGKHGNPSGPSSSKTVNESTSDFYQHEFNKPDFATGISQTTSENLMVTSDSAAWQDNRLMIDDSSFRCVFPCEGNERPSQGLSLSLSSSNPSSIGLQTFELRHARHQGQQDDHMMFVSANSRDGFFRKSGAIQEQQVLQDGFANLNQGNFQLRNSKYLGPAQQLLNEFCNLGTKQNDPTKQKAGPKTNQWGVENGSSSSTCSRKPTLCSLELVELQKRKSKLLSMLEEVY